MPARPQGPWLRKGRGYYCFIDGVAHNLFTKDIEAAWIAFYRKMADAGKPIPTDAREPVSVLELVDRFCNWAEKHRKPMTASHYDQFCKGFVKESPRVRTMAARDLRPFHVQAWVDLHPDWNPTTQNKAASAVKRAFSWATENGLIDADPIRPLRKAKPRRRLRILSAEEWAVLIAACPNGAIRAFLEIQKATGARPQELRAAEIRHYDRRGKCFRFPAEESKGGIARVIVLTDAAAELVVQLIGKRLEGAVLTNTEGYAWTRVGLRMALRRLVASSGVAFDAYTLRHTYATEALENGVESLAVGELMGHVDTSMIAKIYAHLDQKPEYLRKAAEQAVKDPSESKRKDAAKPKKKPPAKVSKKRPPKKAKRKAVRAK